MAQRCYSSWMSEGKFQGGCLCGAFQFEVEGPLGEVRLCHCDLCKRANGSAYSANARVPLERFKVVGETKTIKEFESSPGAWKAFCSTCGSPAYSRIEWDKDFIRLRLGTLPRDVPVDITAHVWVGSKALWDRIADGLPCFEQGADSPFIDPDP